MECHRCKDRVDIEAGKYAHVAYDETPCAKCELKENSDLTMEYVLERESCSQNPVVRMGNIGPQTSDPRRQTDEEVLPLSVMNELVVRLMSMSPESRDVVCWRFAGKSFRDIAAVQGVTLAGAEARLWRALKKWPELRALFATKLARHGRRKPVSGRPKAEGSRRRKQVLRGVEIEKTNG